MSEGKARLISELIVGFIGLILLYSIGALWSWFFLREGTSTVGWIIYFVGGLYLLYKFIDKTVKWFKKLIILFKKQADGYTGDKNYEAMGIVRAGNGKVESKIILNNNDKKPLLAMALCYLAKIKWLILTEPNLAERTFTNIFNNTLNDWPAIPYVEMLSSVRDDPSVYQVTVYYSRRKGWYVNNTIPLKGYYSGDLVTNYFILLKAILSELNDNEKKLLGNLFNNFKDDILGISIKDKSNRGLENILKKANRLLEQDKI